MKNQEIDILVNGRPVRKIAHNGNVYIVGKEGSEYEIRLKNNATNRVLGVCAVDGLNVVDGTSANPNGAGYIIHGYGSYTIKGFRTSDEEVHPFVFNTKDKSYAENSDKGDIKNAGVIGVVFWSERKPKEIVKIIKEKEYIDRPYPVYPPRPWRWPYEYPWYFSGTTYSGNFSSSSCLTSNTLVRQFSTDETTTNFVPDSNVTPTCSVNVSSTVTDNSGEFDLGTEFSDRVVEDKVVTTNFDVGHQLAKFEIYYATREQLIKMGVPVDKASAVAFPESFPSGFCKPPKKR